MARTKNIFQITTILAASLILIPAMMVLLFGLIYLHAVDHGKYPTVDAVLLYDAIAVSLLGLLVAIANFYWAFLRYSLFRWRGGQLNELKRVSLVFLVGTILLGNAAWIFHWSDHITLMWAAITIALLDMGGPQWFILWAILRRTRK